ncbi:MAG: hypothetical protein U0354_16975 [Candidatus Sericytochromatia bacterium]
MAKSSYALIEALRTTANRLEQGVYYQWTHQGSCNCGHLAQTITKLTKAQIHQMALEKEGNWADKINDYCKTSGYPIDHVISSMIDLGMTTDDISNLEKLSCHKITAKIPKELNHKDKSDVILYMRTWADILESELLETFSKNLLKNDVFV